MLFSFTASATTEIYTLSLHDALPIFFLMRGSEIIEQSEIIDDEPREVRNTGTGGSSRAERQREEPVKQHFKFVGEHLLHLDRKSTRLNSSHPSISYAVFCLKKKKITT